MSVINSFVNVIAGATVLLGGEPFMDKRVGDGSWTVRKLIGLPLLTVGGVGVVVGYLRNKRVRGQRNDAESFNADEIEETDQEIAESVLFSCDDCGSMYGRGAGDVLICSRLGQEGHYNHCAGCCPDTESFGAESDATSTMKSILYTLATVGAGVFVFNKYVKDRLPSNGDE
jgi:hypothetical protein